eukprot:gene3885-4493_t
MTLASKKGKGVPAYVCNIPVQSTPQTLPNGWLKHRGSYKQVIYSEIDENITVKEFDADIVYRCCIAYLRVIAENKVANLTASIPKNMSARVNACSVLAATIRELGYRAELSYHNLLYPNVNDTRRIFIFLGQNLPKKEIASGASGTVKLEDLICHHLATSIKESWMPYFCPFTKRIPGNYSTAKRFTAMSAVRIPSRGRSLKVTPGLEDYYARFLAPLTQQPNRADDVAPSVFEYNLAIYAEAAERDAEWASKGAASGMNPVDYRKNKLRGILGRMNDSVRGAVVEGGADARRADSFDSVIASFQGVGVGDDGQFGRKKVFTNEDVVVEAVVTTTKETEEERLAKQQAELDALQQTLADIATKIQDHNKEMEDFISLIRQLEAQLAEEDRKRLELEKEYKIKKKTFGLLENAEDNMRQLQELCQQTSGSLIEMSGEWEKVRRPIVDKYRALKDEKANQSDEAKSKVDRIKEIRALIKKLIAEIRAKEEMFTQLQETYKAAPKDTNRSMYTRRILDTVKNIKKQKVDIDRILLDTRTLQREINSVTDTAVRSFDAVKDMLYADAKKDATAKLAIKSFAVIDEKFQALLLAIDETGTYQNNVFSLTSKIDHISGKTNTLNTDRLLNDLKNVKNENQALIKQVKSKMEAAQ